MICYRKTLRNIIFLLLHVLALSAWLQPPAVAAASNSKTAIKTLQPGEYQRKVADNRKYLLYVPRSLKSGLKTSTPVPLVLFFHGGGGHMEQAAKAYGWRETAEREGFIVAFPNGYSRFPRGHLATWNAGHCCGDARDKKVDDIAFVKNMIQDIQNQLPINPQQIFATGMSNGGMLAHRLACEMADTFRAIAAVAGTDNTVNCQPSRAISVLHIHARDDSHVLFQGGAGEDAFRDKSKVTDFTSVPDTIKRWQQRLNLPVTASRVLQHPGVYSDLWQSADGRTQLQLVVTESGGHSWPGGKAVRGKKPSTAIDANTLIWQFFQAQLESSLKPAIRR